MPNNQIIPVPEQEALEVPRILLAWLNQYDGLLTRIDYDYLRPDEFSTAMSAVQSPHKTRSYITGGYLAQFSFNLICRVQPQTNDERLSADEYLNEVAEWAASRSDKPNLGENIKNVKIELNTRSIITNAYEDGSEDHSVTLTLSYEVI